VKYIPTCMSLFLLVGVSSSLLFLWRRPTAVNLSSGTLSLWPSRLVLSAMYHVQWGLLDSRSLILVMQQSIWWSHCSGPVPCLLIMLMYWAISQTPSVTLSSIHCVVKLLFSWQFPRVFATHWLTPTPVLLPQTRTCRVGIRIVLASATTDFGNQKASHYILGSQWWSMIEWWISNASYSKQPLGVLIISWTAMRYCSRDVEGMLKLVEIVGKVGRQDNNMYGLWGFSWCGDIILTANQLEGNMLSIIEAPRFVDWILKFITKTTNNMFCSHHSLVCSCASSYTPQWCCLVSI
jgi:hypothetical protein